MRPLLFSVLLAWLVSASVLRAAPAEPGGFTRGNTLYGEGKFSEAAAAYEEAAGQGARSANLFYNLAGAYYRAGDRGRAVLNYQRALLLEPRHAEAAANLAFVRGRGPGSPAVIDSGFTASLDADTWAWVAAAGGWLAVFGLGAARWRRRGRWLPAAAGLVGLVLGTAAGWATYRLDGGAKNSSRAVVLADDTRVLYSPADNSKAVAILPAGGEVRVLSEQGAWNYVQLGDGSRGWMAADRVEKIVPRAVRLKAG